MNDNKPSLLKSRITNAQSLLKLFFIVGKVVLIMSFICALILCFMPKENFTVIKGNHDWALNYSISQRSSFSLFVSYKIIQPIDNSLLNAKTAFLTYLFSSILIYFPAFLYGIKQIIDILTSTKKDPSPFNESNIKSLKKLGFAIISFSVLSAPLINIICCLFVTKIFLLHLGNFNIYGIIVGTLVLIISDIFEYGVYLQN